MHTYTFMYTHIYVYVCINIFMYVYRWMDRWIDGYIHTIQRLHIYIYMYIQSIDLEYQAAVIGGLAVWSHNNKNKKWVWWQKQTKRCIRALPFRGCLSLLFLLAIDPILFQFDVQPLDWKTMGFFAGRQWGRKTSLCEGVFGDMSWWSKDVQPCVSSHNCCWLSPTWKQTRSSHMSVGFLFLLFLGSSGYAVIMRSLRVFGSVNWCRVMFQCLSRHCGMAVSNGVPRRFRASALLDTTSKRSWCTRRVSTVAVNKPKKQKFFRTTCRKSKDAIQPVNLCVDLSWHVEYLRAVLYFCQW